MTQASGNLFVDRAVFADGALTIQMGDGRAPVGTLRFTFVRSFLFVKESDFWSEMETAETKRVFADPTALQVFRIERAGLTAPMAAGRFDEEAPLAFLVWTADECFEVICFEEPAWTPLQAT